MSERAADSPKTQDRANSLSFTESHPAGWSRSLDVIASLGISIKFRHLLLGLLLFALVLRVVHLLVILPGPLGAFHRTASETDMYLLDQWARRTIQGDILGREIYYPLARWQLDAAPIDKWMQWHGSSPIFYKAPLYPYFIALCYWILGEAFLPLVILQIAASTASVFLLFRITEMLFDRPSAFLAALFYALYAPAIHYDVFMLRSSFIVLLSLLVTWELINIRAQPTLRKACILGVTLGVTLLLNEGFLTLPLLVVVLLVWWFRDRRLVAKLGGGVLLGLALACIPLVARNLLVGAPPLGLAALGTASFAVSNAADTYPYFFRGAPPSFIQIMDTSAGSFLGTIWASLNTFQGDIGAIIQFYVRKATGFLIPFEYPDNANFYYAALKDPLLRFLPNYALLLPLSILGLVSLVQKPRSFGALLPAGLSLFIGIMVIHPNSRHRAMFAVYLMPLAGLTLAQITRWIKGRSFFSLASGLVGCLVILAAAKTVERQVVFKDLPVEHFKYRPLEFWIGAEVHAREGRYQEASEELLQLARLNPDSSIQTMALLMAAKYQLDKGRKKLARESLDYAFQINRDDPKWLMQIGDFYLRRLNDTSQATKLYRKALGLNPSGPLREALLQRLAQLEEHSRKQ